MKEIKLTKGKVALVDDEDYEYLSQFKWHAVRNPSGIWYARRSAKATERIDGKRGQFSMHRVIKNAPVTLEVDHRNGNGLDNQRENLRLATRSQNMANTKLRKNNTLGVRGVRRHSAKIWVCQFWVNGRRLLSRHRSLEDAARKYDELALFYHGAFAVLNFPEKETR